MSIKLALLKSGETVIADIKELVSENSDGEKRKTQAYLFSLPHKVTIQRPVFLTEEQDNSDLGREVQIGLSPWILLTTDEEIIVPTDWVITIVEPYSSVKQMYEEKTNGQSSEVYSSES